MEHNGLWCDSKASFKRKFDGQMFQKIVSVMTLLVSAEGRGDNHGCRYRAGNIDLAASLVCICKAYHGKSLEICLNLMSKFSCFVVWLQYAMTTAQSTLMKDTLLLSQSLA